MRIETVEKTAISMNGLLFCLMHKCAASIAPPLWGARLRKCGSSARLNGDSVRGTQMGVAIDMRRAKLHIPRMCLIRELRCSNFRWTYTCALAHDPRTNLCLRYSDIDHHKRLYRIAGQMWISGTYTSSNSPNYRLWMWPGVLFSSCYTYIQRHLYRLGTMGREKESCRLRRNQFQ